MEDLQDTPLGGNGEVAAKEKSARKPTDKKSEVTIVVELVGKTPLLMQPMDEETLIETLFKRKRPPVKTDITPEEAAAKKLYKDSAGRIGIPVENHFACLREAGRHVQFDSKRKISTAESTLLPSFLSFEETFYPLTSQTWVTDVRRGMMDSGGKKVAVPIVRPRFNEWGFKATLVVDLSDGMTEATVKRLVEVAGKRIGLCGFRPEKNGPFGQFTIGSWVVQ